jgi:hypothetical protein
MLVEKTQKGKKKCKKCKKLGPILARRCHF